MKTIFTHLIWLTFTLLMVNTIQAQCVPDGTNCIDTGATGQICPDSLAAGTVNQTYEEVITVWPPEYFEYNGSTVYLSHIKILDVENIPPGMTFESNATDNIFAVGSYYCILISGTPTDTGHYNLKISIEPWIMNVPLTGYVVVDSTSLFIDILPETNAQNEVSSSTFSVGPAYPNPFQNTTELVCNLPTPGDINLKVWDELGRIMIEENIFLPQGKNSIPIQANELVSGTYFYSLGYKDEQKKGILLKQ